MRLVICREERGDGQPCNTFKVFQPDWGARRVQAEWIGNERYYNLGESSEGEIGTIHLQDDIDIHDFLAAIGNADLVSESASRLGRKQSAWILETLLSGDIVN